MSVWLSLGFVGFGYSGGLFPELRCGIVAIGCCRGAIGHNMRAAASKLRIAIMAMGAR
jgi:hypothetical protein